MDNLVIWLILMLGAFIGIYLYLTKRFDQNDNHSSLFSPRKMSKGMQKTKFELEKKRTIKDLHKIFIQLSIEEQDQLIHDLHDLQKNGKTNDANQAS